jgi:hypothetical protein
MLTLPSSLLLFLDVTYYFFDVNFPFPLLIFFFDSSYHFESTSCLFLCLCLPVDRGTFSFPSCLEGVMR